MAGNILVFDGDCGFCTASVSWLFRHARPCDVRAEPYQRFDLAGHGIPVRRAQREVLWIVPDGRVFGGADAIARLLRTGAGGWAVAGRLLASVPIRWLARAVYRVVADNRRRLPGGTGACALPRGD